MNTAILLAEGLEECEALVTYDLLYRAGIDVKLVGLTRDIVSSHGVKIETHLSIDELDGEDLECLILPGGMPGTRNLENDERVQKLIDLMIEKGRYVAAICAAPSILIHKGLLKDGGFTCFPGFESGLRSTEEKAHRDGKIITGKGLGAVNEFAALIISALLDEDKAEEVLKKIQYH